MRCYNKHSEFFVYEDFFQPDPLYDNIDLPSFDIYKRYKLNELLIKIN